MNRQHILDVLEANDTRCMDDPGDRHALADALMEGGPPRVLVFPAEEATWSQFAAAGLRTWRPGATQSAVDEAVADCAVIADAMLLELRERSGQVG